MIKHLLFILLVLTGSQSCNTQVKSSDSDESASSQKGYGRFENYAFLVNDKVISRGNLADYPRATLNSIHTGHILLESNEYGGAVYFLTPEYLSSRSPYIDDPAWFINDVQVSSFDARSSRPALYKRIEKSNRDTLIEGKPYKGAIHIKTDEDFFAGRLTLSEVLERYVDVPNEQITVHYFSPKSLATDEPDISMIISDHFEIYHVDSTISKTMKIDRIRLANGFQYVVRLIDNRYKKIDFENNWMGSRKARFIFKDPLAIDTICPCYIIGFNEPFLSMTELNPKPYLGEQEYLKKLSAIMALPTDKTEANIASDSISVRFIVTNDGMVSNLESIGSDKPEHDDIFGAFKRLACVWSIGVNSGLPQSVMREVKIYYTRDKKGTIQSLDSLKFK